MRFHFFKRFRLPVITSLLVIIAVAAACQGSPQTQYLLEVTREVTVIVVVTATPGDGTPVAAIEETAEPEIVITPTVTPTPDPFPPPIVNEIIVSEQAFQYGRMFWLQPSREIWVMIDGEDDTGGVWTVHADTFEEGMPEFDPALIPPNGLYQPERGFGKLWRENAAIQEALGWAVEPEFGHITQYTYVFRGTVGADNTFIQSPGYHTLNSRDGITTFIFEETDGMWRRVPTNGG